MADDSLLHKVNESAVIVRVSVYLLIGVVSIGIAYGMLKSSIDREVEVNIRQQSVLDRMEMKCHSLGTDSAVQESTVNRMNKDISELKELVRSQNKILGDILVHEKGK